MKAKVTKPDGTIIELEGEVLDLVILLPDMKGYTQIEDRDFAGFKGILPEKWTLHNKCDCVSILG